MDFDKIISGQTFDEERALYNLRGARVENCIFAGPADGESALKECRDVSVRGCKFSLRYPLWHTVGFELCDSTMDELTRAPLWYAEKGRISDCTIEGVKCLRECRDIELCNVTAHSKEFGWRCSDLRIIGGDMDSEYFLFECERCDINGLHMKGKYSFQYTKDLTLEGCVLDTKDAFWHSKNVTAKNCVIKGEYLGWYSEGLTLINCRISGTQPLCYCRGLTLINCTMEGTDLSFEYSDVQAQIQGEVLSVKNPRSGYIEADGFGEIILEGAVMDTVCDIRKR